MCIRDRPYGDIVRDGVDRVDYALVCAEFDDQVAYFDEIFAVLHPKRVFHVYVPSSRVPSFVAACAVKPMNPQLYSHLSIIILYIM